MTAKKTKRVFDEDNIAFAQANERPNIEDSKKKWNKPAIAWGILAILAILAAAFFYSRSAKVGKQLADTQKQLSQSKTQVQGGTDNSGALEVQQLVDAVGKLMILPQDEQPTVATVTDLEKLKGQPFFAQAQVGDKVLIYTAAAKAILYRPSENKIIELAPLSVGAGATGSQTANLSIEIRNGSGTPGVANIWKQKLAGKTQFSVTKTGNAANGNYAKSVIVNLTNGTKQGFIDQLQQITGADVVTALPGGEGKSSADVILIVGKQ